MIATTLTVLVGVKALLAATVGIGLAGAILAWRERPQPGAVPLTALLAGQCWWSATLFFRLDVMALEQKILWVDLSWPGIVLIPVAWLWFSLEYTGHSEFVKPRYILAVSVVPGLCGLLGLTDPFHDLFYIDSRLVETNGTTMLDRDPGIGFWVAAAYTYLIGLLGVIPLIRFITSDVGIFKFQSLLILVGLVTPWVTNVAFLTGLLPTNGVDPTPIAFSISGVAYLGALNRFQLLDTNPAPIRPARRSVFRRMQEGALVLDRNDNVVDINERAVQALDVTPTELIGDSVRSVLPNFGKLVTEQSESNRPIVHHRNRAYEVSINRVRDPRGRVTGRIVSLQDITDYHRQQQRLEVLNRVFRHNIKTSTQVIVGNADYLETHNSEKKATKIRQKAAEIDEISEEIRNILDIFERGRQPTEQTRLAATVENCVQEVQDSHPDVTIELETNAEGADVNSIVHDSLLNLIENAAEHNTAPDPTVHIETRQDSDRAEVVIADNGPGIDDEELALVEDGRETPLKHGSGFGLALAVWGVDIAGGEICFEENDTTGTVVTVSVPVLSDARQRVDELETSTVRSERAPTREG